MQVLGARPDPGSEMCRPFLRSLRDPEEVLDSIPDTDSETYHPFQRG